MKDLRSLGEDYSEQAIRDRLANRRCGATPTGNGSGARIGGQVNLLIDIQARLQAGKGAGFERWAKVFNLKEAAKTLLFLQENGITEYGLLEQKACAASVRFNDLSDRIQATEIRMAEINELQRHIGNYNRTRDTWQRYKASGYSHGFRAKHEGDILLHQAAKKAFDALGGEKLPTIKELQTEFARLLTEKRHLYRDYRQAREDMRSLATAKVNTDRILGVNSAQQEQERQR